MSISRPSFVHAGGCAVLPLPGEVPVETSVCPYCIYYHQLSDRENVTEQTHDQHPGYNNSCHGNSPCHTNSPYHCSNPRRGDPQVSEPKKKLWKRCWARLQTKLDLIVGSRYFNRGIMIAILINTLSMGIEYHEQVCLFMCACVSVCVLCYMCLLQVVCVTVWLKMDVLITLCGKVNELTPQSTLTAVSIWDHKVSVRGCVWVCARTCIRRWRNS